ncbi:saccharopine dehydrogenase [Corallococcus exiguus]|uniref:saccharopine dehydrogenase family protein n=1 Tax=Corallococcus TaxID=83461 RepID=UPI000EC0047D|nr:MULTISPECIES: saccharopine dehydrogenase NADP-binding domain-containing protein [Corallococcus]NNB88493.1 saccharopine dehydrogenase [Corallococcus exiguus]NNB97737.1 saccharopine dehydrogenase [Corallococcus exiguus]NNC04774.1 saccharopine dehydrogenase [Corallococcus exiguus]NPC47768.1 saccharopine dehydrogenase [Corallococcus exiguus]RKH85598.1 saccharopine dehydrogenase [Corallococcus sp. AB032C]
MAHDKKPAFDIILWGATGFTGRLVAEYLARNQETHRAKWAIAGRDEGKLDQVRSELVKIRPEFADLPVVLADAKDAASLDAMVARTRVIISTVGPYARYGNELVDACVRAGTDYCDLTGEVQFMRRTIDAHDARARETGARIVHTCGFDSIPSDLGTLMVQDYMREKHGGHCDQVRFHLTRMRGGFSGGTIASMMDTLAAVKAEPALKKVLTSAHALDPEPSRGTKEERDLATVKKSPDTGTWTAPFVMASVNTRVVRRSNALLGYPWGRDFFYSEVSDFGPGPKGLALAAATTAGLGGFMLLSNVDPARELLEKHVLPAPGEGPSATVRERGLFEVRFLGEGHSPKSGQRVKVEGKVASKGDPGYAATARMLAESALCLAFDTIPKRGGVLTPASAMGMVLVERLRKAGMTFEVHDRAA